MPESLAQSAAEPAKGLPAKYVPSEHEDAVRARWDASGAFHADPAKVLSGERKPYCILIPPPNVTGRLHLGHALNNTLQDILVRAHRMMGFETLWMPGTDHAAISTQAVVDKRLIEAGKPALKDYKRMEAEGKNGREQFLKLVLDWSKEYEGHITEQLKLMGCSCDWARQRFTMDEIGQRAVREAFFRLFKDGLIYRGKRLVNWDPATQTALADDEVEMQEIDGFFFYMKYPVVDAGGKETGEFVTVATTRPETYLGDTAVAVNPDDAERAKFIGKKVKLPFVGRVIPVIGDDYVVKPDPKSTDAKAQYASGFLKVTPAHDPNDWEIGMRHGLEAINVMGPDAAISDQHGWTDVGDAKQFVGLSREDARKAIVRAFKDAGLLEKQRDYRHAVGHSYRSHVPIEPWLSDQWYCKVTDEKLVGWAQEAVKQERVTFHPERYEKTYSNWHENLRDWCISRQLWWGHRIPVWTTSRSFGPNYEVEEGDILVPLPPAPHTDEFIRRIAQYRAEERLDVQMVSVEGVTGTWEDVIPVRPGPHRWTLVCMCVRSEDDVEIVEYLERFGYQRDPDVLDTWFSSGLWPMSTMGWPDAEQAAADTGIADMPQLLEAFNPTDVLCTAREIITLWVSRMVMFNRYFLGEGDAPGRVPYRDVFIHAMIQDGEGRKMSKSLGNGVDPLDIIHSHGADGMRFTLCHMTTNTQDVRMPVERDEGTGKNTSPKFDLGRNFVTKLFNAAKFAISKLNEAEARSDAKVTRGELSLVDRWMLSRVARTVMGIENALKGYSFNEIATHLYDVLWRDYCDWYLESVKPTVSKSPVQQAVLRQGLDVIVRLLHPVCPFVTEVLFEQLRAVKAGDIEGVTLGDGAMCCVAPWPQVDVALVDEQAERTFETLRGLTEAMRQLRAQHGIGFKTPIVLYTDAKTKALIDQGGGVVQTLANVGGVSTAARASGALPFTYEGTEHAIFAEGQEADAGALKAQLEETIKKLMKDVGALEGRLNNKGYTDKAPAHLVQQTRDQLQQKQDELAAAKKRLGEL
ncbi:MAG: valine--tRNA ligase [Phycisphaerales bacterium]|nr:valine--tRNA ligase [Phycisphaerales bacterium]